MTFLVVFSNSIVWILLESMNLSDIFRIKNSLLLLPFHHNVQVYLSYNPMVSSIIGYNYADQYNPITDSDVYTSILLHFLFRVPRTD